MAPRSPSGQWVKLCVWRSAEISHEQSFSVLSPPKCLDMRCLSGFWVCWSAKIWSVFLQFWVYSSAKVCGVFLEFWDYRHAELWGVFHECLSWRFILIIVVMRKTSSYIGYRYIDNLDFGFYRNATLITRQPGQINLVVADNLAHITSNQNQYCGNHLFLFKKQYLRRVPSIVTWNTICNLATIIRDS